MLQLTEPNLLINVIFSSHLGRTVPSTVSLSRTDCCYGTIQHRGDETRGAVQDAEEQSEAAGWVARRCARQRRHEDEWRFSQRYHNGPIEGTFCIIASKKSGGCRNSRLCFLRRFCCCNLRADMHAALYSIMCRNVTVSCATRMTYDIGLLSSSCGGDA